MGDTEKSSINLLNSYVAEFNEQFQRCRYNNGPNIYNSLNRSLSLMNSVQDVEAFDPNSVSSIQFYINLHKLLSMANLDDDVKWLCISILEQASKNLEARKAIITKFRFFPVLANMLKKISAIEKLEIFLELLAQLSFGIVITWEEPYLTDLIETLLQIIDSEDTDLAQRAILILINICHKNLAVVCILMRTGNISELCRKTKKFGVLANKLLLILDKNATMDQIEVESLVKKCFMDIGSAIDKHNIPLLQHIVHFFQEIKENDQYRAAIVKFPHFEEEFANILNLIDSRLKSPTNGNGEEFQKRINELSISLTLEFLSLVLDISIDLNKTIGFNISNEAFINISDICRTWSKTEFAGVSAILLLKSLVELANDDVLLNVLEKFEILSVLIIETENNLHSSQYTTALQKLLLVLLKNKKTDNMIFSIITDSYFNKLLTPILSENSTDSSMCSSMADLAKYLHCLLLLVEFSKIAKSTWKSKVEHFFEFYQIKYLLARGLTSDDSNLVELVFEISKMENFPKNDVSKFVAELNKCSGSKTHSQQSAKNSSNYDLFFERNRLIVSKDYEHRLNAMLTKVFDSRKEFENIATSELIELYMYKTNMTEQKIDNLQKNLEDANQRITDLMHEASLQTAELSKFTNINFKMNLTNECLVNENRDLEKQKDTFSNTANYLSKVVKEKSESLKRHKKTHEVRYAEKVNEINHMRNEMVNLEKQRDEYVQKIKQLNTDAEDYVGKIDKLKKSIHLLEAQYRENEGNMEQKDRDIAKLNKNIDELKKSQSMQDSIIKNLENQIKDKNDTIKQLENEINEVEDMRKTIMSLMESKKPKRKA